MSKPTDFLFVDFAATQVVPEPTKGSNIKFSELLPAKIIRLNNSIGDCAGWFTLSEECLFLPDVTFGMSQTSEGFFPNGLTFNFPCFF